ncbi:MAG: hypothetical protein KJ725_07195 [Gammaproteobacteria bacterium]|jgi:hypothetical protein|uniref:hypothetical protein n=1 Tax=Methylotuvimicrobium sp. TaxID=2822413 RepID=UPI001DCDE3F8|nr:hypothetical protein [Gammaproteobacteria bacterium]
MKAKFLTQLEHFFDPEHKKTKHYGKELKTVLRKLKKKERKLTEALEQTTDQELTKLYKTELEIIRIQRKKGLDILQAIRKERQNNQ